MIAASCGITMVLSVATLAGDRPTVVEFSLLAKHAIQGPDPRVDFLNAYGSLRVESSSSTDHTTTNYYCGTEAGARLRTIETTKGITFFSEGPLCGFQLPNGMSISPAPRVNFTDQNDSYDTSYDGQTMRLHIIAIRLEGITSGKGVAGYSFIGDNFSRREVFEIDASPDDGLTVYLRTIECDRIIEDDQLGSGPMATSVESVVVDHAGLVPLLLGHLLWHPPSNVDPCG